MKKKNVKLDRILKIINRIIEVIFTILIILFCLVVLCQRFFQKENSLLGYRVFTIVTESMEPELKVGDVILVRERPTSKIKIGDTITYQGMSEDLNGKIITHQVMNIITENSKHIFYTQGINSSTMDPAVYEDQIYGVVEYKFVFLSFIYRVITNTFGFILLIVLPLSYIFVMELRTIVIERNKAKEMEKIIEEEKKRKIEEEKRKLEEEKKKEEVKKKTSKKKVVKTTSNKKTTSKKASTKTKKKTSTNK